MIERICDIALAAFSLVRAPHFFLPGFLVGFAWCLLDSSRQLLAKNQHGLSCSQSFLERMAGVHFPPLVRIAAEVGTILCHIDHHASVFAPLVGFGAGAWTARQCLLLKKSRRA